MLREKKSAPETISNAASQASNPKKKSKGTTSNNFTKTKKKVK